jgi:uncharacterized membrane protein
MYIDWARGLAVLIMIQAHAMDAWTLPSERGTLLFNAFNLVGGIAAPLFLWLAGLSIVLAGERRLARSGNRAAAGRSLLLRGLEIFVLAFAFRLQAFIVSPGNPLVSLLRVDILNIMGPAMIAAALVWWLSRDLRGVAIALSLAAAIVAMVTPLVRSASWLASLPPIVQWYLSPNGNHSTFTLFPWAGFLFAGGVAGAVLASIDLRREARAIGWIALGGAMVILVCYVASTRPSIYADSSFWHTSPTYFGIRVGVLMLTLALLFVATPLGRLLPGPAAVLAKFGRHSLFVYWIHVELVYGYATVFIHHRLTFWEFAVAYMAFCGAMYWAIDLKGWAVQRWQARTDGPRPAPLRSIRT